MCTRSTTIPRTVTNYDNTGAVIGLPVSYLNLTQQAASRFPLIDRDGSNSGNFAPYSVAWNLEVERAVMRQIVVRLK